MPENIVPVCWNCHPVIHLRDASFVRRLLGSLSDAEYAYMIERGGEDYPERAYGISYER